MVDLCKDTNVQEFDGPRVIRESEEPIAGSTGANSEPDVAAAAEECVANARQITNAIDATQTVEPVAEEAETQQAGGKATELNENTGPDKEVVEDAREMEFNLSEMPTACPQCNGSLHTMAQEEDRNFYKEKYYKTKDFAVPTRCCVSGCKVLPTRIIKEEDSSYMYATQLRSVMEHASSPFASLVSLV